MIITKLLCIVICAIVNCLAFDVCIETYFARKERHYVWIGDKLGSMAKKQKEKKEEKKNEQM